MWELGLGYRRYGTHRQYERNSFISAEVCLLYIDVAQQEQHCNDKLDADISVYHTSYDTNRCLFVIIQIGIRIKLGLCLEQVCPIREPWAAWCPRQLIVQSHKMVNF